LGTGESDNLEIERFLHLKAEIQNLRSNPAQLQVGFEFSNFGFEMQESFDFEIVRFPDSPPPLTICPR
jgi:SH3-like domain-containing protein